MPPVHYHANRFPPEDQLEWRKLISFTGPATAALARYDGVLSAIPNPQVLLSPMTAQEAVLSSRIEGTQATMGEVLQFEAGEEPASPARRDDIHEILNYRAAMHQAAKSLERLPLCQRIIKEAHEILLRGVRGEGKSPGEYRRVPNWIGRENCPVEEAWFVPIEANRLPEAMGAWERYMHADVPDKLVQLAILHAEFEALHPFLDGNGRLGRMLVPLFLWQAGFIQAPMFYISAHFEARRDAYYDGLLSVSRDNDWTGWCRFFLEAIRQQAEDNLSRAQAIIALYDTMKERIIKATRSQYAIYALDWAFERPIFRGTDFVAQPNIPKASAQRILTALRKAGILKTLIKRRGRRAAVLKFPELLNIAEEEEIF